MEVTDDILQRSDAPYQDRHVAFVTSKNGTSPSEIFHILVSASLTPLLASLLIPWIVPSSFGKLTLQEEKLQFFVRAVIEYPIVIIGPLLFMTVLTGEEEETSWTLATTVFVLCMILGVITVNHAVTQPVWKGFSELWKVVKNKSVNWSADFALIEPNQRSPEDVKNRTKGGHDQRKTKYPFITNYRAIVTYLTVICILAVDFNVFPRRFAKTKLFGFSLMDIGTGSFIFANGIVSPEAKNNIPNLRKSFISSVPLFVLGFLRLITVKGIEYHEVVEEYGVHWNFFFTLALVKILSACVFSVVKPEFTLKIALTSGILYESLLLNTGLQNDYILNDLIKREGLLDANREGIFSAWGYLTIYFASIYCGKLIYMQNRKSVEQWCTYAIQGSGHVLILWTAFYFYHTNVNMCCRRAANLSYILWAVATNYTVLWIQLVLTLTQICLQHLGLLHGPMIFYELTAKQDRDKAKLAEAKKKGPKNIVVDKKRMEDCSSPEIEEALQHLENKLKKCESEMISEDAEKLSKLVEEFDNELKNIEQKITDEENSMETEISGKSEFVPLPDLARSPVVLESICYNGLGVFLIGNVLTGLINSLVYSMYVSDGIALFYLWIYATSISVFSLSLYWFNVQIKFW